MAHGVLAVLWLAAGWRQDLGALYLLAWPTVLVTAASAGYSAFLFGQAEGRDFWQSPLVLPHLLLAALTAGCASLLLAAMFFAGDPRVAQGVAGALRLLLVASLLVLLAETMTTHASHDAARAARLITRGPYRTRFWLGVVGAGTVLPFVLLMSPVYPWAPTAAALLTLGGLWLWEDLWVRAGQALPLS
jgi:formate-dependent nitrite reductase membrane component NrfD